MPQHAATRMPQRCGNVAGSFEMGFRNVQHPYSYGNVAVIGFPPRTPFPETVREGATVRSEIEIVFFFYGAPPQTPCRWGARQAGWRNTLPQHVFEVLPQHLTGAFLPGKDGQGEAGT